MVENINNNTPQVETNGNNSTGMVILLILAAILMCAAAWWLFIIPSGGEQTTVAEKQISCEQVGGEFNEYSECLGINETQCGNIGGAWESCGSACRHNPNPDVACTMECVQFCTL